MIFLWTAGLSPLGEIVNSMELFCENVCVHVHACHTIFSETTTLKVFCQIVVLMIFYTLQYFSGFLVLDAKLSKLYLF